MATGRSKTRRKLAQLRACLVDGRPWAMMPSAFASLVEASDHSLEAVEAALTFGGQAESSTKVIDGVAVIPVTGVLRDEADVMVRLGYASSYQLIERDFKQWIANPNVRAVMFYFDSPGGNAIGVKRVADTIFAARGSKPIHGYCQGVSGSASYYLMAACDVRHATADALIGSIGTIYNHQDASKLYEDYGVKVSVITNKRSPKKGHGNQFTPLDGESRKTLDGFIDSYGEGFIADVARYRGISAEQVVEKYGQGDTFRADIALERGMVDSIVANFDEALSSLTDQAARTTPVNASDSIQTPVVAGSTLRTDGMTITPKLRALLFARGFISTQDASDEICVASINAYFLARGDQAPTDESTAIAGLLAQATNRPAAEPAAAAQPDAAQPVAAQPAQNVAAAHEAEMSEARLADLRAAADLVNQTCGQERVTANMVLDAFGQKLAVNKAMTAWNATLAKTEPGVPTAKVNVTGEGSDRFAQDAIDALCYRSSDHNSTTELSAGAQALANRPLWAIAGECLRLSGQEVDMYGARELLAEQAMQMGSATARHAFFSSSEDRRYIGASIPTARPGDFPNILSGLANKYLDNVELDDDYSYPSTSALLPSGLNDFKPAMMVNKGIVEELDELEDAEQLKDLGLAEEVLSYIFLRRFGNRFGWTPVMVANDDLNAFAEGMLGLAEAWQVTQNRLVVDRFTSNETLLDGQPLFADRANTGSGTNPAANNNDRTSGAAPSDTEWAAMENLYADIGGIETGRRVRGTLNTIFCPTGTVTHEATRHFANLNMVGEGKTAATTANVGLFRNKVNIIPDSELRLASSTVYYGLRNPTRLNTATVVRGYFNGFGAAGRRERWYDPSNKTTYISLEGRIAVAVKNWRYAVRNNGA